MICAIAIMIVIMLVGCICLAIYAVSEYDLIPSVIAILGIVLGFVSLVTLFSGYCANCNALREDCSCEPVCCECGQALPPEKDKECNRKEPVEPNKCCGACGQEILVNVEINCEHTATVEVVTTPETAVPEVTEPQTTEPQLPVCPNCQKGVASAFCPNCGYDMYATENCPSCSKEFMMDNVPSYCPDCGEKISDD